MRARVIVVAAFALACACKQPRKTFDDAPPRGEPGALRGTYSLTYYWVSAEDDQPAAAATTTIYDKTCAALAKVSAAFASDLSISGAGKLVDDRMLTVTGECNCKRSPCFRFIDQPWGIGADNRPLVPFRSLAVDRKLIPIGTALWIEQLDRIETPGTFPSLHDGCVVADDIGGRITGERIDWFVGRKSYYAEIEAAHHLKNVTVYDGGERCR
jgi:3D (Asp-Asp-Asp) domain-containing protein